MNLTSNYLDCVKLPNFYPVCDIMQEPEGYWNCFVNNDPFDKILDKVLVSLLSRTPADHKSFWVQGTYGCGKSHAAIVLKHLLCDDFEQIAEIAKKIIPSSQRYAKYESLRKNKRYLAVTLKGAEGAHHARGAANKIKGAVKVAMEAYNIPCDLKTDYDSYCDLLSNNKVFNWEELFFSPDSELSTMVDSVDEVIQKLRNQNSQVLEMVEGLCSKSLFTAQVSEQSICDWLKEAEEEVIKSGYAGIIIFWDELTSMYSSMSQDTAILELLQSIAELTSSSDTSEKHEIYLYLISHKDIDKLEAISKEEIAKISDRFHVMRYIMEPVTTYAILAHLIGNDNVLQEARNEFWLHPDMDVLMNILEDDTTRLAPIQDELKKVYPLHPYTAYLCTYVARNFESSNRTVFKFINDQDTGFYQFLQKHNVPDICTPDFLWRFFLPSFEDDPSTYGGVLEKYNQNSNKFAKGSLEKRVFEAILLLNALSKRANTAHQPQLNPSEDNIVALFAGCESGSSIRNILQFIDEKSIIEKNPNGLYTVENSALPREQIMLAEERAAKTYPSPYKILTAPLYDDVRKSMLAHCGSLSRPYDDLILADLVSDSGKADLKRKLSAIKSGHVLHFVVCISRRESEIALIKKIWLTEFAESIPTNKNVIALVPSVSFGDKLYGDFIRFTARAAVAEKYTTKDEAAELSSNAKKILQNWVSSNLRAGDMYISWSAKGFEEKPCTSCLDAIRDEYCKLKFKYNGDQFRELARKPAMWKNTAVKAALTDLFDTQHPDLFSSKKQLKKNAVFSPLLDLLKDSVGAYIVGNKLMLSPACPEEHPLRVIKAYVDTRLKRHSKGDYFDIADILKDLVNPPYGLYKCPISQFILGYCLHEYVDELVDSNGYNISQVNMSDVVIAIFDKWKNGKDKKGLTKVRFGFPEEAVLCSKLAQLFEIKEDDSNTETLLSNIRVKYARRAKAPLWVLLRNMEIDVEIRAEIKQILEFIDDFSISSHSQEDYSELIEIIDKHQLDIKRAISVDILNTTFVQYILQIVGEEYEARIEEIRQYLPPVMAGEYGYWVEHQVQDKLKKWLENNNKSSSNEPPPGDGEGNNPPVGIVSPNQPKTKIAEKLKTDTRTVNQYVDCLLAVIEQYPQLESIIRAKLGYEEL